MRIATPAPIEISVREASKHVTPPVSTTQVKPQAQVTPKVRRVSRTPRSLTERTDHTLSSLGAALGGRSHTRTQVQTRRLCAPVTPLRVPHTMERLRYQLELFELQGH